MHMYLGGVAKEQAEADQDTSITQRIILAGGGVVEGSSAMAENDLLSAAIETAGIYMILRIMAVSGL